MKLLVLLSRVPYPLEKGDKLRAFNQIKRLARHHEVILCCLNDRPLHPDAVSQLEPYCKELRIIRLARWRIVLRLVAALFSGKPLQVAYFYSKHAQRQVDQLIEKHLPKHIFCQLVRVSDYVRKYSVITKTLDYMDALSKGVERRIAHAPAILKPLLQLEAARLARYEAEVFAAFEHKAIISQQDRALIDHGQRDAIAVIPNGVDPLFFESLHQEKEYEVLFTGNMSYPPNVDSACYLVRDIMPLVWREHPEARVLISGANPAGKVRALAGAKVTVTGWVEDIRHSYARSQIFAAPMQIGTGLQNKLLEAMAMQLPCVTSPLANNALGAAPDAEILIGTDTASFASAIVALLDNTILYDRIAAAGHSYVRARFDWDKTTDQLEQLMVTPSTA